MTAIVTAEHLVSGLATYIRNGTDANYQGDNKLLKDAMVAKNFFDGSGGGGVSSFNGRTGAVTLGSSDIKTVNGQSLLGTGNIDVSGGVAGVSSVNGQTGAVQLKTINGNTLTGTGNIDISGGGGVSSFNGRTGAVTLGSSDIKTINGQSMVGSGNINISGGGGVHEYANVKTFGALGNGSTDDSDAFIAAFATGLPVYVPAGTYIIGKTVPITYSGATLLGESKTKSNIRAATTLTVPMLDVSATIGPTITNITLSGSLGTPPEGQVCLRLRGAVGAPELNRTTISGVDFIKTRTGILIDGSVPVFYTSIYECTFIDTIDAFIKIQNTAAPGVDIIMSDTRFLGSAQKRAWDFAQGLGSIIASNVQISTMSYATVNELCYFGVPATLYGGAQFTGCVFECANNGTANNHAVFLEGTYALPWKTMQFDACIFTSTGGSAIRMKATVGVVVTNSNISGSGPAGVVSFTDGVSCYDLKFIGCTYDSANTQPVYKSEGGGFLDLSIITPRWRGAAPFAVLTTLPKESVVLDVVGGTIGGSTNPIQLSDYRNTHKNIQTYAPSSVITDNTSPIQAVPLTGSLGSDGSITVSHGIDSGHRRILSVAGYYAGGSNEMKPLTVQYIDGNVCRLTGGAPGADYRVTVFYIMNADLAWGT